MPLVRLVVPGGAGVPPQGACRAFFLLGGHFFQGAAEKVMFLERALLSVCGPMVLYSTAGLRGGCLAGLRAKGAPRLGFYVLCVVRFFTKPLIFYDKLVQ